MKRSKSFTIQKRSLIKHKDNSPLKVRKQNAVTQSNKNESVPQAILKHISKRSDVQIIVYYEAYRQQFFTKNKRLQEYLVQDPSIRNKWVTDSNPHFKYGMQYLMLDLYHKGVIVPNSYNNLKMQAVELIQNWVLSWIQRKLLYQSAKQQQKQQVLRIISTLTQLQNYVKVIEVEELPF